MVRGPVNKLRSLHRGRKGSVWNTERGHKIGVGFLFRGGSGGTWCTGLKEAGGATNRGKRTSLRMTRARSNDDERNCSQHWHERKKKKNHFLISLFFQNSRYSRFIYRWLEFMIYNTYERFFFTPFFFKTYNFEFPFDTLDFKTRDLSGGKERKQNDRNSRKSIC